MLMDSSTLNLCCGKMFALRSVRLPRACVRALGSIAVNSPEFSVMRSGGAAFVDKTGAIADLLNHAAPGNAHRLFFARPRKFGKSLTLSVAAEMLAAGALPPGVAPWPGYAPLDAGALFGGLQVHERLLAGDASLRSLLQRPHFVVKLSLGEAQTGAELCAVIKESVADIAEQAFGEKVGRKVMLRTTPGGALGALVAAVPSAVPVALLVDEYDAAIIQDVSKGRWAAADAGLEALRSLLMSTKSPHFGSRIERCLVTGVARFAHASLFSGANNFTDLTGHPLLSRVLGFSAAEIRATFPAELKRLAGAQGTDESGAMQQLAHWYNGYCFDGVSTCFNPFPVLTALEAGRITGEELQGASSYLWLGVQPAALLDSLGSAALTQGETCIDIADLEAKVVNAAPLLLQTGLLTLLPRETPAAAAAAFDSPVRLAPPNEFARATLRATAARSVGMQQAKARDLATIGRQLLEALQSRSHASFQGHLLTALSSISARTTKNKMLAVGATPPPREAPYHTFLHGLLLGVLEPSVGRVSTEVASAQGDADIVLHLEPGLGRGGAPPSAVWILEVGLGSTEGQLAAKVDQGKAYAKQFAAVDVLVCALLVNMDKGKLSFSWARRASCGAWAALPASPDAKDL
jgi:hypothetical protein